PQNDQDRFPPTGEDGAIGRRYAPSGDHLKQGPQGNARAATASATRVNRPAATAIGRAAPSRTPARSPERGPRANLKSIEPRGPWAKSLAFRQFVVRAPLVGFFLSNLSRPVFCIAWQDFSPGRVRVPPLFAKDRGPGARSPTRRSKRPVTRRASNWPSIGRSDGCYPGFRELEARLDGTGRPTCGRR